MYKYILLIMSLLTSISCDKNKSSISDFHIAYIEIENAKGHVELADVMNALKWSSAARVSKNLIHFDSDNKQKWTAKFRCGDGVIILMDDGSVASE